MNEIVTSQNSQINIDRLDAQRHLYTIAKRYNVAILFLCVIMPVLISFAKVLYPNVEVLIRVAIFYSFLALFVKQILSSLVNSHRNLAARIQQLFDCELFRLDWNEALCGKKPQPEEVFNAKTGTNIDVLRNWYEPIVQQLPLQYAVIVCMRTNVVYDQRIRKTFLRIVDVLIACAGLFVFSIGLIQNNNMWDWFLNALIPLSPIISWFIDTWRLNNKNIDALNKLQSLIDGSLSLAFNHQDISTSDLENIQNLMFIHRNTSYTIPDCIYNLLRSKSENAAYYSAQQLYEKIK